MDEKSSSHIDTPALIKKYIRGFGHNVRLTCSTYICVIKVKPFFVIRIPSERCVVSPTEGPKMIRNSIQIVQALFIALLRADIGRFATLDVWTHVKSVDRKVYQIVDLARAKHCVPSVREALQVYYQIFGSLPDLHLFVGCHVVSALAAVPFVVSCQSLFHHEVVETIVDGHCLGVGL